MCTAITYKTEDFYFGRNLDLERDYGEAVTVTPRNFPFKFRNGKTVNEHFAIIGMAAVFQNYPLYFDATNEKGLSIAGLNFPGNAVYYPKRADKINIAPFELIPYILGLCADMDEALEALSNLNLWNTSFSADLPLSPLHWIITDRDRCVTVESLEDGLKIYENPVGILTNNPPFDFHMHNLQGYMSLTANQPVNRFSEKLDLKPYSLGLGSFGLPGDLSSPSRFIKAAFTKMNSVASGDEASSISQFLHILSSVAQQRGLNRLSEGIYEYTLYSSCCNTDRGIYYYTTYENSCICAVDMHKTDLDSKKLSVFPLITSQQILTQN